MASHDEHQRGRRPPRAGVERRVRHCYVRSCIRFDCLRMSGETRGKTGSEEKGRIKTSEKVGDFAQAFVLLTRIFLIRVSRPEFSWMTSFILSYTEQGELDGEKYGSTGESQARERRVSTEQGMVSYENPCINNLYIYITSAYQLRMKRMCFWLDFSATWAIGLGTLVEAYHSIGFTWPIVMMRVSLRGASLPTKLGCPISCLHKFCYHKLRSVAMALKASFTCPSDESIGGIFPAPPGSHGSKIPEPWSIQKHTSDRN